MYYLGGGKIPKTKIVYRKPPKKKYRRRRAYNVGKKAITKNVIDGLLVGVVNGFVPHDAFYGIGQSIPPLAVGYIRKNNILQTLGALQLGGTIAEAVGNATGIPAKRWL